ncbi:MAG TPA: EamA family transporter [Patescibacteria group bacterium]|nr:EamA family transporter [Patescibacteria group bacterium]
MITWIIPLAILVFFEAIADIFAKEWSLGNRSIFYAVISLLAYLLANTSWLIALKYGSGLARGAIIFSVASALLASIIGLVFYKEQITTVQAAGIVLGIVSIFFIFWE